MEFGASIRHPVLQTVVGIGEATIRQACERPAGLEIHVEMMPFADGREGVQVTLKAPGSLGGFFILLRKYFDQRALERVARHAWMRRVPCGVACPGWPRPQAPHVSLN